MIGVLFLLFLFVGLTARVVRAASGGNRRRNAGGRTLHRGRRLAEIVPVDPRVPDYRKASDPILRIVGKETQ